MACFLGQDSGEILDYGGIEALDGDISRIRPAEMRPDDGIRIEKAGLSGIKLERYEEAD